MPILSDEDVSLLGFCLLYGLAIAVWIWAILPIRPRLK